MIFIYIPDMKTILARNLKTKLGKNYSETFIEITQKLEF